MLVELEFITGEMNQERISVQPVNVSRISSMWFLSPNIGLKGNLAVSVQNTAVQIDPYCGFSTKYWFRLPRILIETTRTWTDLEFLMVL